MSRTSIRSEEGFRRYFAMVPNMVIDDERLTMHDRALYLYFARVCGQDGKCFRSRDRIAREVGMSWRSVVASRKHLDELGYITVRESDRSPVVVQIADIWDANMRQYTATRGVQERPPGVQERPPKKNPLRRSRSGSEGDGSFSTLRVEPEESAPERRTGDDGLDLDL